MSLITVILPGSNRRPVGPKVNHRASLMIDVGRFGGEQGGFWPGEQNKVTHPRPPPITWNFPLDARLLRSLELLFVFTANYEFV